MVEYVEVAPRDGLQNEPVSLSVDQKVALIEKAIAAGARRLEVASFVRPDAVPQMAGAEDVVARLVPGAARYIGLVLNKRGAFRALATNVHEVGFVCVASDTFGMRNQRQTSEQSLSEAGDVMAIAQGVGRAAHAMIAVAWGCPFEGATSPDRVLAMAEMLAEQGSMEVGLADTIGIARPDEVESLTRRVKAVVAPIPVRVHLHDTRGMGVANAMAAIAGGASIIDAAIGGTGGCPFAPGAAGNLATEDLAYALGKGLDVDLDAVVQTAVWLNEQLSRTCSSALVRASLASAG
ncbi:hydroxymethylglutaryl-CoA lyase [Hyphomonas johnsonii]|uniref:Hydroxymethylglutaryl-CoA lyase n=1 Tax=Hyphomonas johnsonii MHS-2 TaxID=1280950 RepID=A0A059FNE3_9PROT|nr:hydroxymethylglutaryl-CoA lyase [Hyphomonas johnsonii]KCZ92132.1 hydroxymethylglutaryl-CoA lyase [Hyphomonas johnsonii MHS-2]